MGSVPTGIKLHNNLGQVVHIYVLVTKQYNLVMGEGRQHSLAGKVKGGLAESNGRLSPGMT